MSKGPKLSRKRRQALQDAARAEARGEKALPNARLQPHELTTDQRKLLVQLNIMAEAGCMAGTTGEIAAAMGWEPRYTVEMLRQLRALGLIAHDQDGAGKQPDPALLEALRAFGLWGGLDDATPEELDALVLIEQGAERLPEPERAGFLIGCGLQELREQGHDPAAIRKLVLGFLDAGAEEWRAEEQTKGAAN